MYHKACTNYFPVLLCTTNCFPVLLCTTKLAQTTSQYYFALQSLHKPLPSTTVYYKACTKHLQTMRRYECDMSPFLSCSFCFPSISLYVVFKSFLSVNCSFHQGQLDPPKRSETTEVQHVQSYYFPVLLPSTTVYYKA